MKLKFELRKSTDPDMITWECMAGYGYYRGRAITPGAMITFSRHAFSTHPGQKACPRCLALRDVVVTHE